MKKPIAHSFARVFFVASLSVMAFACKGRPLPGQDFIYSKSVKIGIPERYTYTKDNLQYVGFAVTVSLDKGIYSGGVPTQLTMQIKTDGPLRQLWRVSEVEGVVDDGTDKKPMSPRPFLVRQENIIVEVVLENLEPTKRYAFRIYFKADGKADHEEALLLAEKGVRVNFLSKQKD